MRSIAHFDSIIINWFKKLHIPLARFALFVIFFWFGFLKVIGLSPAGPLVESLFHQTISFMSFDAFYLLFGWFECLIGILFLIPKATRLAIPLLAMHMIMTSMPLILLPEIAWQRFMVPTLEGQYIIKNLALIGLAIGIASNISPLKSKNMV